MDIENLKKSFKQYLPDFIDFKNPSQKYLDEEYNYKKAISVLHMKFLTTGLSRPLILYPQKSLKSF